MLTNEQLAALERMAVRIKPKYTMLVVRDDVLALIEQVTRYRTALERIGNLPDDQLYEAGGIARAAMQKDGEPH